MIMFVFAHRVTTTVQYTRSASVLLHITNIFAAQVSTGVLVDKPRIKVKRGNLEHWGNLEQPTLFRCLQQNKCL